MRGSVTGFDSFTVVLLSEGRQQMIYKHAISTIAPLSPIDLHEADETVGGHREKQENKDQFCR